MNKRLRSFTTMLTALSMLATTNAPYIYALENGEPMVNEVQEDGGLLDLGMNYQVTTNSVYDVTTGSAYQVTTGSSYLFLSDFDVIPEMTQVGYGSLMLDKNIEGKTISLKKEGKDLNFIKGIGAHAPSNVTYDLTGYEDYTRFVTYAGIDASRGSLGNGAIISIQVSRDGMTWETKETSQVQKGDTEAFYVEVDIEGYKYLRLNAKNNGNSSADHVVYGHPRILKKDYDMSSEDFILDKTLEEYDLELKTFSLDTPVSVYENLLYQRTLVSKVGYEQLKLISLINPDIKEIFNWLLNDSMALYYYITGGSPESSYIESLNILSGVHPFIKEDFNDPVNGDFYKKLAITMCLVTQNADTALERYRVYKDLYNNDRLFDSQQFKALPVETLRLGVNGGIDNIQIPWLNAKVRGYDLDGPIGSLNPYDHMKYRSGYNYKDPKYYSAENFSMWDEKYQLSRFNITYGDLNYSPFWIMFEEGAVCGGISEAGTALYTSFGIPVVFVAQPGHAAYLTYSQNAEGKGIWQIGNNISGFKQTRKGGRLPLGWGSASWVSNYTGSYYLISQHALNNYEDYVEALDLVLLADVYNNDNSTKQQVYRKALQVQPYNLDAMEGLLNTYKADPTKTNNDFRVLAREFGEALKYFPLAMVDMLTLIGRSITDDVGVYDIDMAKYNYLQEALVADSTNSLQPSDCRSIANFLLGNADFQVATFSFDGENAGKIVMGKQYENSSFQLQYSLDGGVTWQETSNKVVELTPDQIIQITPENDIKLMIVGSSYQYTIDILEGIKPEAKEIYLNDWENRLIGDVINLEYSLDGGVTWMDYIEGTNGTHFGGDSEEVLTRCKASGVNTRSETTLYTFTEDKNTPDNQYISLERLSVVDFSSQGGNDSLVATNVLDGNIYSHWQTATSETEDGRYITIELDKPTHISQIQYIPIKDAGNGTITKANISVSLDNTNWYSVGSNINWPRNSEVKTYRLADSVFAKYIKIQGVEARGNYCSASVINVFEDKTKNENVWFNLKNSDELYLQVGKPYDLEANIESNYGSVYNTPIKLSDFDIRIEKLDEAGNVVAVGKGLGRKGTGELLKSGPYRVTYSLTINGQTASKVITAKVLGVPNNVDPGSITLGNKVTIDNSQVGIGLWDGMQEEYFKNAIVINDGGEFTIDVANGKYGFVTLDYGIKDSVRKNTAWGKNGRVQLRVLADNSTIYESDVLGWYTEYISPLIEIPKGTKELKFVNVAVGSGNNHAAFADIQLMEYEYGVNWTDDEVVDEIVIPIKDITLNTNELNLKVGTKEQLVATITPTDTTMKDIVWESTNAYIMTVTQEGVVEAKEAGTANIICKSVDNQNVLAVCKVTVIEEPTNPDEGNGGGTTNPDEGNGGGTTNPDEGNGGGTTNPDEGNGGGTTNPDEGNGGETTNPDEGNGGSTTNPSGGIESNKTEQKENTNEDIQTSGIEDWLVTDPSIPYLKGVSEEVFNPDHLMTRAQVAQMLFNLLKDKEGDEGKFHDVEEEAWYFQAISVLAGKGILKGYNEGIFEPNKVITRAEFISIISRFAKKVDSEKTFKDVPVSHWAHEAIATAIAYGWIVGYEDNEFKPNMPITRAEATVIVNRMLKRVGTSSDNTINFKDVSIEYWAYEDIMLAVCSTK